MRLTGESLESPRHDTYPEPSADRSQGGTDGSTPTNGCQIAVAGSAVRMH